MHGVIHLLIQSAHLKYEMTFYRNITILKGDSATGKTTLVDMIQEYNLNGADTGINLSCDVPCRVLAGNTWMEQPNGIHKSLGSGGEGDSERKCDIFHSAGGRVPGRLGEGGGAGDGGN